MSNEIMWIFGIFFFFFLFRKFLKSFLFSKKVSFLIRQEFDEIINGDEYKVRGKND